MFGAQLLRIKFDKVGRFIRAYVVTRYLVLFGYEKCDVIYNRIRYLASLKSGIIYVISHIYARMKINSYGILALEKTFTLHNVIILIKSVFNNDQNHYYRNIFLKKCSYK